MTSISLEDLLNGEEVNGNVPEIKEREALNPEIIKFQVGDVIIGRYLPNTRDKNNSWIEYTQSGIQSQATGEYVDCGLLRKSKDRNLKDPLTDLRQKLWTKYEETKDETFKEARNFIRITPKVLFNWFTISHKNDRVDGFVEETLKNRVLRLPANRDWKTKDITSLVYAQFIKNYKGDADTEKLGNDIFNLGPSGISYKIKIVSKGDYISYDPSGCGFESKQKAIPGLENWKEPYSNVYDLTKYVPSLKSEDEINDIVNNHLTDIVNAVSSNRKIFNFASNNALEDDDIPMTHSEKESNKDVKPAGEDDDDADKILQKLQSRRKSAS